MGAELYVCVFVSENVEWQQKAFWPRTTTENQ